MSEQLTQRRMNKEVSEVSEVGQAQSTVEQHGDLVLSGKAFNLDHAQPLDVMSFPNPPRKETSPPPATIPNVAHLLDKYSIQVRYDVIKKKILITLPGHSGTVDNLDNVAMTQINSLATLNGIPIGQVPAIVEALADRNMYNPVVEWITSKQWDGKNRLPEIYATVTEQQDYPVHLKEILTYKWLLSSVAAVLKRSGFKARGVLTFQKRV